MDKKVTLHIWQDGRYLVVDAVESDMSYTYEHNRIRTNVIKYLMGSYEPATDDFPEFCYALSREALAAAVQRGYEEMIEGIHDMAERARQALEVAHE